jgi:hypothetical protein
MDDGRGQEPLSYKSKKRTMKQVWLPVPVAVISEGSSESARKRQRTNSVFDRLEDPAADPMNQGRPSAMNLLGLKHRGLGLDTAVGKLRDLCRSYNPAMVFLCETKKKAKDMNKLKWSLGFTNSVAVDCVGRSGGLALWWKEEVEVQVRPWCHLFIDAKISYNGKVWRFSGIYGEPRSECRF